MAYKYVNTPVGETVNVRKSASTSSAIVGRLSRGTRVNADFSSSGFWHITSPLMEFIHSRYRSPSLNMCKEESMDMASLGIVICSCSTGKQ